MGASGRGHGRRTTGLRKGGNRGRRGGEIEGEQREGSSGSGGHRHGSSADALSLDWDWSGATGTLARAGSEDSTSVRAASLLVSLESGFRI